MLRGILPKEFAFFDYFEKLVEINIKVSEEFLNLAKDNANLEIHSKKIKEFELEADKVSHICTEALHKTFITPIERSDIYSLVKKLDDVTDQINFASSRLQLYEITHLRNETIDFAEVLVECSKNLATAVHALRNLHQADIIKKCCQNVHELESKADDVLKKALSDLFKEGDAIYVIKWKEIYERLEKAVDRCENIANIIEGILIDNA